MTTLPRSLLSIEDLDRDQLTLVLDTAERMAEIADRPIKKVPTLRGLTVCNLFLEDSTRTRISFDVAAKRLSADVISFSGKGSSVSKGESFKDTALTLDAMGVDAVVVRSGSSGAPLLVPPQLRRFLELVDLHWFPLAPLKRVSTVNRVAHQRATLATERQPAVLWPLAVARSCFLAVELTPPAGPASGATRPRSRLPTWHSWSTPGRTR